MQYMLVLQLPEELLAFDELVDLEDLLIDKLGNLAEVDGHDVGAGEINFFVLTNDVPAVFEKIQSMLGDKIKSVLKAAYRDVDDEEYHVVYPEGLEDFQVS